MFQNAFTPPLIARGVRDLGIEFVDLFCGAGGSSTGLVLAGYRLLLAVNHWRVAVDTHAANHREAEHWCEDIDRTDMRRLLYGPLRRAKVLWASPICTEATPAGGSTGRRSKRSDGQIAIEELGHVEQPGFERTRATFWDVLRAVEVRAHAKNPFLAVAVENVPDVAWRWELLDLWCLAMMRFGYRMQILSASSAHLGSDDGNEPAPQWRNRSYWVFTLEHLAQPDLAPRPPAWCPVCAADVPAVQRWKPAAKTVLGHPVGKYREQYTYTCPRQHAQVEPYVRPAASVIDWTDLGERIGDRRKPLAAKTMERIRAGLAKYPTGRTVVTVNHDGHDGRAFPADDAPLPTRSTKVGEGILVPAGGTWNHDATGTGEPMRTRLANEKGYEALVAQPASLIVEFRRNGTAEPVGAPLATVTAQGNHHGLVVPEGAIYVKHYGGRARPEDMSKPVDHPLGTITTSDHHALVVPYRNASARPADQPMHTLATRESAGLLSPIGPLPVEVEDCTFRMLTPREHLGAQAFPADYRVHGNKGEQTAQAGNAVSVNAARFIGERLAVVLA
jgi:DNA (cytosine-5)-methyltransferase 1